MFLLLFVFRCGCPILHHVCTVWRFELGQNCRFLSFGGPPWFPRFIEVHNWCRSALAVLGGKQSRSQRFMLHDLTSAVLCLANRNEGWIILIVLPFSLCLHAENDTKEQFSESPFEIVSQSWHRGFRQNSTGVLLVIGKSAQFEIVQTSRKNCIFQGKTMLESCPGQFEKKHIFYSVLYGWYHAKTVFMLLKFSQNCGNVRQFIV